MQAIISHCKGMLSLRLVQKALKLLMVSRMTVVNVRNVNRTSGSQRLFLIQTLCLLHQRFHT